MWRISNSMATMAQNCLTRQGCAWCGNCQRRYQPRGGFDRYAQTWMSWRAFWPPMWWGWLPHLVPSSTPWLCVAPARWWVLAAWQVFAVCPAMGLTVPAKRQSSVIAKACEANCAPAGSRWSRFALAILPRRWPRTTAIACRFWCSRKHLPWKLCKPLMQLKATAWIPWQNGGCRQVVARSAQRLVWQVISRAAAQATPNRWCPLMTPPNKKGPEGPFWVVKPSLDRALIQLSSCYGHRRNHRRRHLNGHHQRHRHNRRHLNRPPPAPPP